MCLLQKNTNGFWKKYREDGFEAMASLYEKDTLKNKMRYCLKNTMNKANISQFYYKYDKQKKLKDQKYNLIENNKYYLYYRELFENVLNCGKLI